MDYESIVFSIVLHAGNARSAAMEAVICAKKGDVEEAHKRYLPRFFHKR
ncbi:MAG: PTS lactose/cellobiose transporter subunit IIA [Bacillota bacterium]